MDVPDLLLTFKETSDGPDPRRTSLHCKDYHVRPPYQEGYFHQVCCCDPCLYVRLLQANENTSGGFASQLFGPHSLQCCRCVPRGFFALFTPSAPLEERDNCCHEVSRLIWFSHTSGCELDSDLLPITTDDGSGLETDPPECAAVYSGTLGAINIIVKVGRFFDGYAPKGDPGVCAWRFTVGTGDYDTQEAEVVLDDPCNSGCLSIPKLEFGPFEAYRNCPGMLSFVDFIKHKLPFLSRAEEIIVPLAGRAPYGDQLTHEDKFIDLCPSECEPGWFASAECLAVQWGGYIHYYNKIADINGHPAFQYISDPPGITRRLFWRATSYKTPVARWVIADVDSGEEIGWGGVDDTCPLGPWSTINPDEETVDPYEEDDPFCVSRCDSPRALCGQCVEVCVTICISGNFDRNSIEAWAFREAEWFRDLETDGTGDYVVQGWKFGPPGSDAKDQKLFLTDSGSDCSLVPNFSGAGSIPLLPSECGVDLYRIASNTGTGEWYSVHCGSCSMWDYTCGSCRCVPDQMCLVYWIGNASQSKTLTWDGSGWSNYEDPYDDGYNFRLERGADGNCWIMLYEDSIQVQFYMGEEDGYPVYEPAGFIYDCKKESWLPHTSGGLAEKQRSRCLDPEADYLVGWVEGFLDPDGLYLSMLATSLTVACEPPDCGWVCPQHECSSPSVLRMNVSGYHYISGPYSPIPYYWNFDIDLPLVLLLRPDLQCWYRGVYVSQCPCEGDPYNHSTEVWTIEVHGQDVDIYFYRTPRCVDEEPYRASPARFGLTDIVSCDPVLIKSPETYVVDIAHCTDTVNFPGAAAGPSWITLTVVVPEP